jgi:hypothetical protein
MANVALEDWRILVSLFPEGWQDQAKLTGAIERQRGITSPEALLRLYLLHVGRGYSLRETAVRAKQGGVAAISDVGLLKRLRRSEEWLRWLCQQLFKENGLQTPREESDRPRRVRIVDGTVVREPGKTGSEWRIVYSLQLPDLYCDHFDLTSTDGKGSGESFARVPVEKGDLILGDAGYSSAANIRSVTKRGGDVLVRINPQTFLASDNQGKRFDLLAHLNQLKFVGVASDWIMTLDDGSIQGRVCALRKTEEQIERAHRRIKRHASKKQIKTKPETWEYAKYVVVFTTDMRAPSETVLQWYQVRWQIELAFKRLKSLAQLGHLPKYDDQSSRAWLYGKLFVALLAQKMIRTGRDISPWGYELPLASPA